MWKKTGEFGGFEVKWGIWRNKSIWAKIRHLEKTKAFRGFVVKYHFNINMSISFRVELDILRINGVFYS